MNIKFKKFAIIFLVAGFGILTGLKLKELFFVNEGIYKPLAATIMYFLLMSVMFYEWLKIINTEKK